MEFLYLKRIKHKIGNLFIILCDLTYSTQVFSNVNQE